MRQIIVAPKPSDDARNRSKLLADSIVTALRAGGDFAVAARRFSMDPTSAPRGGDLDWFRRGAMVAEFERQAFSLKPGVVSDPFETSFGWHILQVQRVQPTEVQARHILLMPDVDSAGSAAARARIEEIQAALATGASFDSLQRLYHDVSEERQIDAYPVDSLLPAYSAAIAGLDSGKVSPAFKLDVPGFELRAKGPGPVDESHSRREGVVRTGETADRAPREQMGEKAYIRDLRRKT